MPPLNFTSAKVVLVVFESITAVPETTVHTEVPKVSTPRNAAQLIPKVRIPFTSLTNGSDLVPAGIWVYNECLPGKRAWIASRTEDVRDEGHASK